MVAFADGSVEAAGALSGFENRVFETGFVEFISGGVTTGVSRLLEKAVP